MRGYLQKIETASNFAWMTGLGICLLCLLHQKKKKKTELEKDCGKGTLLEQSALPLFIQIETAGMISMLELSY